LSRQRWFAGKDRPIRSARLRPLGELAEGQHMLAACDVEFDEGVQTYFLPLSARWGEENIAFGSPTLSYTLAKLRRGPRVGAVVDATQDQDFAQLLLAGIAENAEIDVADGKVVHRRNADAAAFERTGEPR